MISTDPPSRFARRAHITGITITINTRAESTWAWYVATRLYRALIIDFHPGNRRGAASGYKRDDDGSKHDDDPISRAVTVIAAA